MEGEGRTGPIRLRRLAFELRVRRRRLDAFAAAPAWPGKEPARHSEQLHYDRLLLAAARMLELRAPDECPLPPAARAALEDRLAVAGLDVFSPLGSSGDPFDDDDLVL